MRYPYSERLCSGVVSLILDQFGVLITCPIQKGDGAHFHFHILINVSDSIPFPGL
jgi:hypothetical protein